jgi:hypothetical protein
VASSPFMGCFLISSSVLAASLVVRTVETTVWVFVADDAINRASVLGGPGGRYLHYGLMSQHCSD